MFVAEFKKLEEGDKVIVTKGERKDQIGTVTKKSYSRYVTVLFEDGSDERFEHSELKMETQKDDYLSDTLGRKFKPNQHVVYVSKRFERLIMGVGRITKVNPSGKVFIDKIMEDGENVTTKQSFITDYTKCFIIPINDEDVVIGILHEWDKQKMLEHFKDRD
jgi:hypothetical protein